ncbi:MAG: DNA translocase FtsK [Candidatus Pacebacteria bacterium]|nr:DNA translocase FtsK [Candidatus Paceibacterota bacterium]
MALKKKKKNNIEKQTKKEKNSHFSLKEETKKNIWGIIFLSLGIFCFIAIFGGGGRIGENLNNNFDLFFGRAKIVFSLFLLILSFIFFWTENPFPYFPVLFGGIFIFIGFFGLCGIGSDNFCGTLGKGLASPFGSLFGRWGGGLIFLALFLIGISIAFDIPIFKIKKRKDTDIKENKLKEGQIDFEIKEILPQKIKKEEIKITKDIQTKPQNKNLKYKTLPLDLLTDTQEKPFGGNLKANANIIKRTLHNFGIEVEMGEVNVGPTVTQYTLKPAEGIRLSRIAALSNDLSLALAAHPIRIEAPIPGKSLVGIEVPNEKRAKVPLRFLLSQGEFQLGPPLTFPLGVDVNGDPSFSTLIDMPHLLVAGASGSGKTFFLNSMIISFLYKHSPADLRFILIDPKRMEFSNYEDIPHLLAKVIVDHKEVAPVLKWLIGEMDKRFHLFQKAKTRNIEEYNKVQVQKEKDTLPLIVLMIDEMADIMAAKGKEVEASIVRLAQMARAVGIHLVLATQRPSVEVLTGLIKANITSRIAFRVGSQVDSRTILDMAGAEKLLGKGDMLFISSSFGKPRRFQAPMVYSQDIKRVVRYILKNQEQNEENGLEEDFEIFLEEAKTKNVEGISDFDDELYGEAKRLVIETKKASASFLQRKLGIGYARAARLLDMLEEEGIIGPSQGAKPREVYWQDTEDYGNKDF